MPAFYTHLHFTKDIYNSLNKKIQDSIDYDYLLLFAQSHDILFYDYGFSKKSKIIRHTGHLAHHNNSFLFFKNIINSILESKDSNKLYKSFLYGSLTHYILDSTFHPYIFYKTGKYISNKKESHKYNGLHTKYELFLDQYYFSKDSKSNFQKIKFHKTYDKIDFINKSLINFINNIYQQTFFLNNININYFSCLKKWRFITKYFKVDKYGLKKVIYKFIDKLLGKKVKNLQYYAYSNKYNLEEVLNNEHNIWYNPADNQLNYNYSIDELYESALNKCLKIIKKLEYIFENRNDIDQLESIIPNISYYSGLDLELKRTLKYFEF